MNKLSIALSIRPLHGALAEGNSFKPFRFVTGVRSLVIIVAGSCQRTAKMASSPLAVLHAGTQMKQEPYRLLSQKLTGSACVVVVAVSLQGCGDATLQRLSAQLAAEGQGCPQKLETFYDKMNVNHRKMDADELKLRGVPELQGIEVPNPGIFTAKFEKDEVIRPRVKMAEMLASYCSEIDKIVNAKTVPQADQAVMGFNGTIQKIGAELLGMQSIASKLPISAITALAQPIKTLGELGLKGAFSFVRENWAKDTITRIDASFEEVCINMERDLKNSAEDAKDRARNISHLRNLILQRKIKNGISEAEKNTLIADVTNAGAFADTVADGNPKEIFEKIRTTMNKLASWASEKTKEQSKFTKLLPWKR